MRHDTSWSFTIKVPNGLCVLNIACIVTTHWESTLINHKTCWYISFGCSYRRISNGHTRLFLLFFYQTFSTVLDIVPMFLIILTPCPRRLPIINFCLNISIDFTLALVMHIKSLVPATCRERLILSLLLFLQQWA